MYLDLYKKDNNTYVLDIECDGLKPTVVWCVCLKNLNTREEKVFTDAGEFKAWLSTGSDRKFIGHNLISFDIPVLNRLWDTGIAYTDCVDCLILSYLFNPVLEGGHSLDAWGGRLGFPKQDFSDWSRLTDQMVEYCKNDVELTRRVYIALSDKLNRYKCTELACLIEHKIRVIVDEQQRNGFYFDKERASEFRLFLRQRQSELSDQIQVLFPDRRTEVARHLFRRRKDGSPFASYVRHVDQYNDIEFTPDGNEYIIYDKIPFNIGSPKQRVERLLELGWKPEKFTEKGFPKVDEDALVKFADSSGRKEVSAMAEWLVLQGRASMLDTWFNNLGDDSRIHGQVFTCGASTRRCTHSSPNSANIPSGAKAKYGKECRALWGVEPGKGLALVGVDAAGLETVGLLHYLSDKYRQKAADIIGRPKPNDVHTMNAKKLTELLGRPIDREYGAKTCVPLDTKILTRRGWKSYNELEIGESVLGYNQETKLKEWTTLRAVNLSRDEVFKISNSHRTFYATGNHRWFVRQRGTGKRPLKQHYLVDEVRTTNELTSESSIVINAPFNLEHDRDSLVNGVTGKYDVDYVQRVLDMSHSEREQFLQGFILADGHITNGQWAWTQNVNNISEGLFLASYLVHDGQLHYSERDGVNSRICTVKLSAKSHITCQRISKESVGIQDVWCPTTDLGSWVMRQGNEISITGNCLYAIMYGAMPPKVATIIKGSLKEGELVQQTIIDSIPGLKQVIEESKYEFKHNSGRLETIDGGFVVCHSSSAALNYRIQSLGALVMKVACILLHEEAAKIGLDFRQVGFIHDELQMETREENSEALGKLAVQSIEKAANQLKFKYPLTGEWKSGLTWQDTH